MTTDEFLRQQIIPLAYRQLPAAELMTRAGTGDPEAFIALVCLKYSHVESACRQVLGPTGPTEDVALEAFVQLWRQRERLRDAEAVDGWLTRTARNIARKLLRAEGRGRVASHEWWQRTGKPATNANLPDRAAMQTEMVRRVRLAVAKQSDADQRVLWMAENAAGDADAAESLGLSATTYRVRLHRARQRLRALLKKYGVAPVVGAVAFVGGLRNRAVSAVGALWATAIGKLKLLGLVTILLAAVVGVGLWATGFLETKAPLDVPIVPAVTRTEMDRARAERVFAPLIEQVESSLKPFTFGNQGEIRFRELQHDPIHPSVVFDWRHKHVKDGEVKFDILTVLEVGYDPAADQTYVDFYPSGPSGPKRRINPDQQIVPWVGASGKRWWSFNLIESKRAWELLQHVRLEYVVGKNKLDALLPTVVPKVIASLRPMLRGNEATVEFQGADYASGWPKMSFHLRHRQVVDGKVVFDAVHIVDVMYVVAEHSVHAIWWPESDSSLARVLTPGFTTRVVSTKPSGPNNPSVSLDLLDELTAAMQPVADAFRRKQETK